MVIKYYLSQLFKLIVKTFELHLTVNASIEPINAIDLLHQACVAGGHDLSKQSLKKIMQKGAVWLTERDKTQRLRRAKKALTSGQELHLYYNHDALSDQFEHPTLVKDCGDYSVWYKPSGMMSQGSKWGDHSTIARFSQLTLTPERPAFLVHRLDRATQGLIIIAHSKAAVRGLTSLFENRKITKKYQAIVVGDFSEIREYTTDIEERSAYTKVSLIHYCHETNQSLVDVEIGSGRKHQIRRHLSADNWPIVGDRLYGIADKLTEYDLQLCAYYLAFECPMTSVKQEFTITPKLLLSYG